MTLIRPRTKVRIPGTELRRGCDHLLARVLRHAECARALYDVKQFEGAFLFALLGFEELGKLIQLVDAGQEAEVNKADIAEVAGFLVHADKAEQSAKNVALAFDLLIPPLHEAGMNTGSMVEYVAHVKDIKERFGRLREGMMYVDFDKAKWMLEPPPPSNLIYLDYNILYIACAAIWSNFEKATNFRSFADEFNKDAKEFKEQFRQLIQDIMKEAARLAAEKKEGAPP